MNNVDVNRLSNSELIEQYKIISGMNARATHTLEVGNRFSRDSARSTLNFTGPRLQELIEEMDVRGMRNQDDNHSDNQFYVVSGRPAGEVFHRAVFGPYTQAQAQQVESALIDATRSADSWLYGPHITDFFMPDQVNDHAFQVEASEATQYLGI